MRVITGQAKGRRLATPKSARIRPALDQVKEAIFNILFDVRDLTVLDLFAGTGSMGIEALSRGAHHATFVDDFASAIVLIRKNLDRCGFSDRASVIKAPVGRAIAILSRKGRVFDVIFVDPPYLKDLVGPTLGRLSKSSLLTSSTIIIVEHHPKEPVVPPPELDLTETRRYGQTHVSFLRRKSNVV